MPSSRVLVTVALTAAASLATALGVAAPPSANASASTGYTYTTIVAETPDREVVSCALNNSGEVAVFAHERSAPGSPWRSTLVRADGSSVTAITGAVNGLTRYHLGLDINDAGQVAVGPSAETISDENTTRILLGDGGPVRVVARSGPGEVFSTMAIGISINNRGRVVFGGRTSTSLGLYTGSGAGPLVTRYLNTDAAVEFGYLSQPVINDAGQIAFTEYNADRRKGVYRVERDGSVTRLYGPAPVDSQVSMNQAGRVAFMTYRNERAPREIRTARGPVVTLVASIADGFINLNYPSINDAGQVAFMAFRQPGVQSIYTGSTPSFAPVVQAGDVIGGREVYSVRTCGPTMLNNAGQVAFLVTFMEDYAQAVVRADPVA